MNNIELAFENPWFLLLAIPAFAIILIPFFMLPKRRRKTVRKIVPVVLHIIIVTILVLILSGFTIVRNSDEQAVLLLVDLSDSTATVQTEIAERTEEILNLIDKNTPVGVIAFGENQIYTVKLEDNNRDFTLIQVNTDATNIDAALEYAASLLPSDKEGRIILLTDGKETDGDADSIARYLATQNIRIDAVYFDTTGVTTAEIQINSFTAPEGSYVGDEVVFTAEIKSNIESKALLLLYDNDILVNSFNTAISSGSTVLEMAVTAESAGIHTYRLVLDTETDTLARNNECYAYLDVADRSSVLIIANTIADALVLESVLSAENTVTTVTARNAPASIIELCNYDEVILSNVDYADLPGGYDTLLNTYVGVYGRSLLTVGGTETYMYGHMEGTDLEEILPVTFSLKESSEYNSVALMLVLDCSSSMNKENAHLSVAKQGAIKCVETMSDNDFVGIISFNRNAYLQSSLLEINKTNKDYLTRVISSLTTSNGTYYTEALEMAHEELLKSDAKNKFIIFLSDGNPADYGYSEIVSAAREDGITVSTIGLGYSSTILAELAETGGGRYYYVDSVFDLPDIMLKETEQITLNSLITGEFVPVISEESELTSALGSISLPMLEGYLGTTIKENATAYLVTEEGHPIYASWKYGFGTVACFTSDLNGTWSSQWLSNEAGQVITANMVKTTVDEIHYDSSLYMEASVRGTTANIVVNTYRMGTDNTLNLKLVSDAGSENYVLIQTDPGVYETSISTGQPGIYEMTITETDSSNAVVDYLETAIAVSYSSEYDIFAESGEQLLVNMCSYSGGEIFTDMQELVSIEMSSISIIHNPMDLLGIIAVILLLTDIAIRKLRWKDVKNYLKNLF